LRNQLISEAEHARRKKPENKDISKQQRQISPGDHKCKLQDKTIKYLTKFLSEELRQFGYL